MTPNMQQRYTGTDLLRRADVARDGLGLTSDPCACRDVQTRAARRNLVGHIMPVWNNDDDDRTVRAPMMGRVLGTRRRRT